MYYLLIFLFFFHSSLYSLENKEENVKRILNQIPEDAREKIKFLFSRIFCFDILGFTLFGDKPVSFSQVPLNHNYLEDIVSYGLLDLEPKKDFLLEWNEWEKNYHRFMISNYLLYKDRLGIVLINKQAFIKCTLRNKKSFMKILGDDFDPNKFLDQVLSKKNIFSLLKENHELFGILLGFGNHNPRLFQKREEGHNLNKRLLPLNMYDFYFPIVSPMRVGFVADHTHHETLLLKEKYENLRIELNEIYSKDDWFERIMKRMSE